MKNMDNSRLFERFGIGVPVRIELVQSRCEGKIIESSISNLSAVGAFLPELKCLPVGQMLKAEIFFLFEGPNPFCKEGYELITMTVNASVIRSGPGGTGIAFKGDYRLSSRRIVNNQATGQVTITEVDENYRMIEDFLAAQDKGSAGRNEG